jgi:hypothetical protein
LIWPPPPSLAALGHSIESVAAAKTHFGVTLVRGERERERESARERERERKRGS